MRLGSWLLGVAWFGALGGWSETAAADAAADALFRAGREAAVRGDYATAKDKFQESNRLEPAPGTDLNLAICEENLGHPLQAWELYERVQRAVPSSDPRAEIARRGASGLDAVLSRLTLVPSADLPADARVLGQGREYGFASLGIPLRFEPGVYHFRVEAQNRLPRSAVIELLPGTSVRLVIEPGALLAAKATRSPAAAEGAHSIQPWVVTTFGAAGALTAVSLVAGYGTLREKKEMDRQCDAQGCSEAGLEAARRGDALERVATVTFLGALAVAGVGVGLLVHEARTTSSHQGIAPSVAVGIGQASAAWRF